MVPSTWLWLGQQLVGQVAMLRPATAAVKLLHHTLPQSCTVVHSNPLTLLLAGHACETDQGAPVSAAQHRYNTQQHCFFQCVKCNHLGDAGLSMPPISTSLRTVSSRAAFLAD